jgi:hypothetical protein
MSHPSPADCDSGRRLVKLEATSFGAWLRAHGAHLRRPNGRAVTQEHHERPRQAAARGRDPARGSRFGTPRCRRIRLITAASSMSAGKRRRPPHRELASTSNPKVRSISDAQHWLLWACRRAVSAGSASRACAGADSFNPSPANSWTWESRLRPPLLDTLRPDPRSESGPVPPARGGRQATRISVSQEVSSISKTRDS